MKESQANLSVMAKPGIPVERPQRRAIPEIRNPAEPKRLPSRVVPVHVPQPIPSVPQPVRV